MNDDFGISDAARDYSPLGLTENPFPYSPVPADEPEFYCGQTAATSAIGETISAVLSTGKSKHMVLTGRYGNGKSHTLKYTRSLLTERADVLVGYVPQPGGGFLDIYHEFLYDLGFDRLRTMAYEYLADVAELVEAEPAETPEQMQSHIDSGAVLLSEVVPPAIDRLSQLTRYPDFARALVHLLYDDTKLYAWQWLSGEGIRYEQRKQMEVHSALDDDTTAVRAFTALQRLLAALGYRGVFVFIDEFEGVARQKPKDMQHTLNSIRHLMDQNPTGLCLLFACAPEVWQQIMAEYHAFGERIGEEVVIAPLTEEDMQQLLDAYLHRPATRERPLEIFESAALQLLHQRSQGNARQVISTCARLLDYAIDAGRSHIDAETIERYYEDLMNKRSI
jgi:type II secretory pathway predicted ATPase ExeA